MLNTSLINLKEIIKTPEIIYGHIKSGGEPELLTQHLERTQKYFRKLLEKGKLDLLNQLVESLSVNGEKLSPYAIFLIKDMFANAIYLHDLGKTNPTFQSIKLGNYYFKSIYIDSSTTNNSGHSRLSALYFIGIFYSKIMEAEVEEEERVFLGYLMYSFSYAIAKHHSKLGDGLIGEENLGETFLTYMRNLLENITSTPYYTQFIQNIDLSDDILIDSWAFLEGIEFDEIKVYILNRLLFSFMTACDSYATYEYWSKEEINDFGLLDDIDRIVEIYENTDIYKGIEKYSQDRQYFNRLGKPINALRSEMFLEAEKNLLKSLDKNIFYLPAPTGAGKTNMALNLMLKIMKNNKRIRKGFYVAPFNTLIEQTGDALRTVFPIDEIDMGMINSITPIKLAEDPLTGEVDYDQSLLARQFFNYPITLTSHVQFFSTLFGTSKQQSYPLHQLLNSVVVLDEIQSYRNDIWKEIIMFLAKYAETLNIKIIIMSATLPKLHDLLPEGTVFDKSNYADLIKKPSRYFNDPLFKSRVTFNYKYLDKYRELDEVADIVQETVTLHKEKTKFLIQVVTKKQARLLYNELKERYGNDPNIKIYELTTHDNKAIRTEIINETKREFRESEKMILVATSVIEAGVDIDMDIGLKDISLLDSEEQLAGRINRSANKKDCVVYFFMCETKKLGYIYNNDFRLGSYVTNPIIRQYLEDKDFSTYYKQCVISKIERSKSKLNAESTKSFLKNIKELRYETIETTMRLIDVNTYRIYLAHNRLNVSFDFEGEREEYNGITLWQEYIRTLEDRSLSYAKKRVRLSFLQEQMSFFLFNIYHNKKTSSFVENREVVGDIYYIENGIDYLDEEGKFNEELIR